MGTTIHIDSLIGFKLDPKDIYAKHGANPNLDGPFDDLEVYQSPEDWFCILCEDITHSDFPQPLEYTAAIRDICNRVEFVAQCADGIDLERNEYFVTFPELHSSVIHRWYESSKGTNPVLDLAAVHKYRMQLKMLVDALVGKNGKREWGHFIVSCVSC